MGCIKLFSMVQCKGYMEKVKDGITINLYDENGAPCGAESAVTAVATRWLGGKWEREEFADLSEFSGQTVEKTYFERREEEFVGCFVGYKRIVATGMIGTGTYENFGQEDRNCCFKKPKWNPKVGIVYYKNNAKRYVLVEDMEEVARANPYEEVQP